MKVYYTVYEVDSNNEKCVEKCCTTSKWRCYIQFLKWVWHHKVKFSDVVQQNTYYGTIIEYIIPDNNKLYIVADFL